ncbi:aspartate dehydrogenase [Bradyrhizobium sp. U87765 SZCCT0131]|uniref:aspartate dehydrogenase n=1 Tax=unclassified Bradyrhizobium TaxID=2631580 RepID=UPI001BA731A1|nr:MULTISPECIES: aspartate dehydrogenase [unclassified Bradyrhizobium]MBR1218802.1 aspartate dehydrogenase [Bradyrhizobium sp. U87765 SZCCT0131]MBR1261453.1 aspartate dehydrogenase [Bradyrhizobium sp. U87765 SZCCT0134]MBR1306694.1 aspartate dehydrogenase [Bradyrhizobium sp. U87765 SZCCT0110]MBR1317235.1 aspartate dehydrogenase [Bradyrhizobium sp. U87765 SZCCT0109]MBR1350937.1 aspartate dehydrogenase [Bradyrhizobium sp. U87765 SZCCT0048]
MKLGLIGYGTIATELLATLQRAAPAPFTRLVCLARPDGAARAAALLDRHADLAREHGVVHAADELAGLDLVVECAGQAALAAHGPAVLAGGADLVIASVGALADDGFHAALRAAAQRGNARIHLPAGAVGGIDALKAAQLAGLDDVLYRGRKPPAAWKGSPAEGLLNLDALRDARVFFSGSAREAARSYPKNANVAAIVALAGLGFDATRVELAADPAIARNVHEIEFRSRAGTVAIRIENAPAPDNPRTSLGTAHSLARAVLNATAPLVI